MSTIRLYWKDAYLKSMQAKVIKIDEFKVWLDKTCFYPESGGQAGDRGVVNGSLIIDTKFDENKDIVHILKEAANFKVGDVVLGEIDWERRYKIMKVHSASHIREYFLWQVFGNLKLLGSNCNENRDSSTYASTVPLDPQKLKQVEELTNAFIHKNLPIKVFDDPQKENFRWWECERIKMPCGGTHPHSTAEIGSIKLKREKGGKDKEKVITFLV